MAWRLLLTSNKVIVRKKKNGSKTITYRLQCTPWPTTTSTAARLSKELSWSARLILYYQEFKTEGAALRQWKHKALKRIDMYNELMHDEKERTTPMKAEEFNVKKD